MTGGGEGHRDSGAEPVTTAQLTTQRTSDDIIPSLRAGRGPIPALTILCHPDLRRVGDRALLMELLSSREASLSRSKPVFVSPGTSAGLPLADPRVSRTPIELEATDEGIRITRGEGRIKLTHRGAPLPDGAVFSADDLRRGVVLEIAGRIVLLLHHTRPPVGPSDPSWLVGESDAMQKLHSEIQRVKDLEIPVLLRGETGTGKELVARVIHETSARRGGPFVDLNLGALPSGSASAELFGGREPEDDAARRRGYFDMARGGTLFLDEVAEAPPALQAMLFRALETGALQWLGGQRVDAAGVRVIAATSADLESRVAKGTFREPLLHRLSGYVIWVPSLRERRDDIGRLIIHFLREELDLIGEGDRMRAPGDRPWLPASLVARLADADWPGNVRQLRNVVRQIVIANKGQEHLQIGPTIERLLPPRPAETAALEPGRAPAHAEIGDPREAPDDADMTLTRPSRPPSSATAEPPPPPHTFVLEFSRAIAAGDRTSFRFEPQDYNLRAQGGEYSTARIAWSDDLLRDLDAMRRPRCDPAIVQRVGDVLRGFLSGSDWSVLEFQIQDAIANKRRVYLTIRSAAAELYALPWELLTLKASGAPLGRLPEILIRHAWPDVWAAPESDNGAPRPPKGRVMIAWSAAGGVVPAAAHVAAIREAAEAAVYPFDPDKDVRPHATFRQIAGALKAAAAGEQRPISVLHLLCHGGAIGTTFGLVMEGEEGDVVVVDAGDMAALLQGHAGMVRLVVIAACDGGNVGELGNHLGSIAQRLHRAGVQAVIASRVPLSVNGSIRLTQVFYRHLLVGPSSLEESFLRARAELAEDTEALDWASVQLYSPAEERDGDGVRPVIDTRPVVIRPYRGLLPFWPKHGRFFFGRDTEIAAIVSALEQLIASGRPRFLVVAGPSGVGKSSLVLAGVLPRLLGEPQSTWTWARIRPGECPSAALRQALSERHGASPPPPHLLVIDQFDEIFVHVKEAAERTSFARTLWSLAGDPASAVTVILTLRIDFIDQCRSITLGDGRHLDQVILDRAHHIFVTRMDRDRTREAIERPAHAVGLKLTPGLADVILDDAGSEPGVLPLLQHTMHLLWQLRRGRTLCGEDYQALGGVTGALRRRADALMDGGLPAEDVAAARALLVRLVRVDPQAEVLTRKRLPLAHLRPGGPEEATRRFDRVLERLVAERLVVVDRDRGIQTVEVAHETLIRGWSRLLQWVRETP